MTQSEKISSGMIKVTGPDSWDFGAKASSLVKVSSRGLIGFDRMSLIKSAGAEFVEKARKIKFEPDEIPLHVIAMGSTEGYGSNRNADGFKEAALKKYHDTFVKHARVYQHHKNKDPEKSYGVVKMSHYNEAMRRVELLLALNKTAEAAKRNGGLVDEALNEKAASGEDLGVSMACKIAYDVCEVCQNKAPTRNEYCESIKEGGTCHGFGCKHGLARVLDNGMIQHVDNPHPRFFDISYVRRPADRTAYGGLADYLQKAASRGYTLGGAELAELLELSAPSYLLGDSVALEQQMKIAQMLAGMERDIEEAVSLSQVDALSTFNSGNRINVNMLGSPGSQDSLKKLAALSENKIALSVDDFTSWICGGDNKTLAQAVRHEMPGIFSRITKSANFQNLLSDNAFNHRHIVADKKSQRWADELTADCSLDKTAVCRRSLRAAAAAGNKPVVLLADNSKRASDNSLAEKIAEQYALYKIAFLDSQKSEMPLTAWFAIRQNYCY